METHWDMLYGYKTKVTCLYINKMLICKFEIKIMVDLKSEYNYVYRKMLTRNQVARYIVIDSSYHYIYIN